MLPSKPLWSTQETLDHFRDEGVTRAVLAIRGRPMLNENFYRNQIVDALGITDPPYMSSDAKSFSAFKAAKEMKGNNSLLLIEATETKYGITPEGLFSAIYIACQRENYSSEDLRRILAVLVIHTGSVYLSQKPYWHSPRTPLNNGEVLLEGEANRVNAVTLRTTLDTRGSDIRESLRAIRAGTLIEKCSWPRPGAS